MGQSHQSVQFMAIGDWGMDTDTQIMNGKEMAKISASHEYVDNFFAVALGDDFYQDGVKGTDDPKWSEVFSLPFKDVKCPWYPILGNHDWEGNVQAQIDFRTDSRWQMPNIYYTKTFGRIQLVFIDTTILCPEISAMFTDKEFPPEPRQKHLDWLDKTLKNSSAEWIIVFGHYPVYSGGSSGIMGEMKEVNNVLMKYNNVDCYISGHDHCLQHLYCDKSKINYFVSGSGCERTYCRSLAGYSVFWVDIEGFLNCTIRGDIMTAVFVSCEGKELYKVDVKRKQKEK